MSVIKQNAKKVQKTKCFQKTFYTSYGPDMNTKGLAQAESELGDCFQVNKMN